MSVKFDKSIERFPIKSSLNFLNFCGVSPVDLYGHRATVEFSKRQLELGYRLFAESSHPMPVFKASAAKLLNTEAKNISFIPSAAHGLNLLANSYPFSKGDQIISYIHEYPSNHYPWKLQERRGAELKLLSNFCPFGDLPKTLPQAWDFDELEKLVSKKTKIIALSHVQFCSGFAADLEKLCKFCAEQKMDLVIDAAQSLGCLNIDLKKYKISALVSSGWKWLLGPLGASVLYSSAEFREKLELTMVGVDTMKQVEDYLNYSWDPHNDGRIFECSTQALSCVAGLEQAITHNFLAYGMENVEKEVFRLQQIILDNLDPKKYRIVLFDRANRSGILSILPKSKTPEEISAALLKEKVATTVRGGYLGLAPHYCTTDQEALSAVNLLNSY